MCVCERVCKCGDGGGGDVSIVCVRVYLCVYLHGIISSDKNYSCIKNLHNQITVYFLTFDPLPMMMSSEETML